MWVGQRFLTTKNVAVKYDFLNKKCVCVGGKGTHTQICSFQKVAYTPVSDIQCCLAGRSRLGSDRHSGGVSVGPLMF